LFFWTKSKFPSYDPILSDIFPGSKNYKGKRIQVKGEFKFKVHHINSGHDRRSGNVRKNHQPHNQKEPIMGLFGIPFIFLIKGKDLKKYFHNRCFIAVLTAACLRG